MTDMSQTFDELNAMWQAEVDELNRSVEESQKMINALLEGQRAKDKVWVVVSDGHNLDVPCVNVCATEARAEELVKEMWDIWLGDNPMEIAENFPEPSPCHQGHTYAFEHEDIHWENNEWHYVYEVEIDQ
jgi:hypothetical protein